MPSSSSINIAKVSENCKENGWQVLSDDYTNLKTEMKFLCPENHIVFSTYGKLRKSFSCPICSKNRFASAKDISIPQKKKEDFRILALDQATQISGWAIFDNEELLKFGKLNIDSGLDKVERISAVRSWLMSMIDTVNPDLIVMEDIQLQDLSGKQGSSYEIGVNTFKALAELLGTLSVTCFENNVPYKIVHSATWRGKTGVRGRTRTDKKRSAQLLVKKLYDVSVSEDEADAICIGIYGSKYCDKPAAAVKMIKW